MKLLLVFVTLALAACAGVKERATQINRGDSKAHVLALMGSPEDRQFRGNDEALTYSMVTTIGVCDYTIVWLRNEAVTGVSSYKHFSTLGCRSGLQNIDWANDPQ